MPFVSFLYPFLCRKTTLACLILILGCRIPWTLSSAKCRFQTWPVSHRLGNPWGPWGQCHGRTCTDLKHPQTKVRRVSHLADSIWIILISFSNSHDFHVSHGGFSVLGCRVHDVHAAFVLCHVLNASWFVVLWCPEAEDQVWTAAKTGTSSLTKSLTNMCKWFIWSQMHLIHFMHCASCYQTFSMCFFRFCRTLSQAFGTVTGISCILAQVTTFQAASSFGRKPSQSNYTLCQSSSLSSSCGGRNEQRQGKEPAS